MWNMHQPLKRARKQHHGQEPIQIAQCSRLPSSLSVELLPAQFESPAGASLVLPGTADELPSLFVVLAGPVARSVPAMSPARLC
jgi:hypothetical protein